MIWRTNNVIIFIVLTSTVLVIFCLIENIIFLYINQVLSIRSCTDVSFINVWYLHVFAGFRFLVIENHLVSIWRLIYKIEVHIIILWRYCIVDGTLVVNIVKILKRLFYYALVPCLMPFRDVTVSVDVASYYRRLSSCMDYSHRSVSSTFFHYFLIFEYRHFFFLVFFIYMVFYVWSLRKLLLVKLNVLFKLVLIPVIIVTWIDLYPCLTYGLFILIQMISFAACHSYIFLVSWIHFKIVLVLIILKICLMNLLLLVNNQIRIDHLLCFKRGIVKTIWYKFSFQLSSFL
jgi:hypothetical protein